MQKTMKRSAAAFLLAVITGGVTERAGADGTRTLHVRRRGSHTYEITIEHRREVLDDPDRIVFAPERTFHDAGRKAEPRSIADLRISNWETDPEKACAALASNPTPPPLPVPAFTGCEFASSREADYRRQLDLEKDVALTLRREYVPDAALLEKWKHWQTEHQACEQAVADSHAKTEAAVRDRRAAQASACRERVNTQNAERRRLLATTSIETLLAIPAEHRLPEETLRIADLEAAAAEKAARSKGGRRRPGAK